MFNLYKQLVPPLLALTVLLGTPFPQATDAARQTGWVRSGATPIVGSTVTLYGKASRGGAATVLGKAETDESGYFKISYKPVGDTSFLYILADGGFPFPYGKSYRSGSIRFATVLSHNTSPAGVVLNELSTVGTAFTLAQFVDGTEVKGSGPGPRNAADIMQSNLVDISTGQVAQFLTLSPNGSDTSTLSTFNSLANLLAVCVTAESKCPELFRLTTPPGGKPPRNTFDAALNIAHDPGRNLNELFRLSQMNSTYLPALPANAISGGLINSWVLALRYIGDGPNGQGFDGPGNLAFDEQGSAWINNNYAYQPSSADAACGSTRLLKLTPTGKNAPGAPFGGVPNDGDGSHGGGLYGAGFGIAVDPKGAVWVTNFGFQTGQCTNTATDLFVSVSKFGADGQALSPDGDPSNNIAGGYLGDGKIGAPQGVLSDRDGNVWLANCYTDSVTRFHHGKPDEASSFSNIGLAKPFAVAIDTRSHVWVTGNGSNNVVELDPDGTPMNEVENIDRPMGIASDSRGNLWVAGAGITNPPCPGVLPDPGLEDDGKDNVRATVSLIRQRSGKPKVTTFRKDGGKRDGLRWPWGIAVDGNDNVWVANFAGQRLMQLCGVRNRQACPPGVRTGAPLSPDTGYFFNGLERVTGVQIDPSGNVWAVNNWLLNGPQVQNPGGRQAVVFLGLAGPVKTPLLGTPRQP